MRYLFRHGPKEGFTLAEIIFVVAIIAMAASLAVVAFGRIHETTVFKGMLRDMQGGLRKARGIAMAERLPAAFNASREAFWIEAGGMQRGKKMRVPKGVSVQPAEIVFFPKGDSTGGSISIADQEKRRYEIEVDRTTGLSKLRGPDAS